MATAVKMRSVSKSATAAAVLESLAKRERNRSTVTVTAIQRNLHKEGADLTRHDITKVLRNLEKAGAGMYLIGRRGYPSRFIFSVPVVEFAKEAVSKIAA